MYLDQSTLRHQGQNRAFEAGTCKKSRISISSLNDEKSEPFLSEYSTKVDRWC